MDRPPPPASEGTPVDDRGRGGPPSAAPAEGGAGGPFLGWLTLGLGLHVAFQAAGAAGMADPADGLVSRWLIIAMEQPMRTSTGLVLILWALRAGRRRASP